MIIIVPCGYPLLFFNEKNRIEILQFFEFNSNFTILYSIVEYGKVKIKLTYAMTFEFVNDILQDLAFIPAYSNNQYPLASLPKEQPAACIDLSCLVQDRIDEIKFLTSIQNQFSKTSSKWIYNDILFISKNQWLLNFSVDPQCYLEILQNNRKIIINGCIFVITDVFNPFKIDMQRLALHVKIF